MQRNRPTHPIPCLVGATDFATMSGLTREIVTLQVGHYANFVGTHWWNIQNASFIYDPSTKPAESKEINSDVLFREGQNLMGDVTYTPRLIAFDLKGSLNTLKQSGTLYDIQDHEEDLMWNHDITMHKSDLPEKNEFLQDLDKNDVRAAEQNSAEVNMAVDEAEEDAPSMEESGQSSQLPPADASSKLYNLDDTVKVWSDFLHPHMHPLSVHIIDAYQHNSEVEKFDMFGFGAQVYANHRDMSTIEDRLHFFAEECDNLQGFHFLVDTYDGFGGLAAALMEEVADEFSGKGLLTFSLAPAIFPDYSVQQMQYNIINTAIAYERLLRHSSLFLPLSMSTKLWQVSNSAPLVQLPHIIYRPDLHYHTSAVLSTAVDSLSVPYRKVNSPSLLTDLTNALSSHGRKVACIEAAFPFPLPETSCVVDALLNTPVSQMLHSLTPSCRRAVIPRAQSVVVCGIPHDRVFGPVTDQTRSFYSRCGSTLEDVLMMHLQQTYSSSLSAVCTVRQPCHVTAPFTNIFADDISSTGFVSATPRSVQNGVESVPVMTSLQSSASAGQHVNDLLTSASKLEVRRLHRAIDAGLEPDEYQEVLESLQTAADCYVML